MVEMLVAISIISVSLLGILALVSRSLGLNRVTTEQYIATYLAAEGIELTKNFFDHSYLATQTGSPPQNAFYGWQGTNGVDALQPGIFYLDADDGVFRAVPQTANCVIAFPPTKEAVSQFFKLCGVASLPFLDFTPQTGYRYLGNTAPTKFRRVIIIDEPNEAQPATPGLPTLDYRVTSAVGWESRGGEFVVQLEDHFLPWRIP